MGEITFAEASATSRSELVTIVREDAMWDTSTGTLATDEEITSGADQALTTDLDTTSLSRVFVAIEVTTSYLDEFKIQVSPDGTDFYTIYSTAAEYMNPGIVGGPLLGTGSSDGSGDLTSLADGESGWYELDCTPYKAIRHLLSSNATSTVTVKYSGK